MDTDGMSFLHQNENLDQITKNPTIITASVPIVIPFLPFGFVIIFLTTLGIFGNILCGLVLSRTRLRSSYTILILGLTFCDTLYLITKLIRYGLDSFFTYFEIASGYTNIFLPIIGPYLRPITFSAHTGSTYFILALAIDRYIAVCWSSKCQFLCTRQKSLFYSAIIFLFAILYNITRWWEFYTETESVQKLDGTFETIYSMKISELRTHSDYKLYYIFWSYFIVMFVLPFSALSALNLKLWLTISRINRQPNQNDNFSRSRDNSFTLMLVGVVIVFLICNLDYLVLDLLDFFSQPYSEFWNHLGNVLLTVNSAVNFIIYCLCGEKFREELATMTHEWFRRCRSSSSKDGEIASTSEKESGADTNTLEVRVNYTNL